MSGSRFQVTQVRGGVFPSFELRDTEEHNELIQQSNDREDLQTLADILTALYNFANEPDEATSCSQ